MTAEGWVEKVWRENMAAQVDKRAEWQARNYREETRKQCIDFAIRCAGAGLTDKDVLTVAQMFESYVFGGLPS